MDYSLTSRGQELGALLRAPATWAAENAVDILNGQDRTTNAAAS